MSKNKNIKQTGQIFTPQWLVELMLDEAGYKNRSIIGKDFMDNSCGNGAFLTEAVRRYCEAFFSQYYFPYPGDTVPGDNDSFHYFLRKDLENRIHGIEIDPELCKECRQNLDDTVNKVMEIHDMKPMEDSIRWDIVCSDTLDVCSFYYGQMDYVIGNPPYVRTRNLSDKKIRKFWFSSSGMADIYLAFFDLGIKMLKPCGKLCYITPRTWTVNKSGQNMRMELKNTGFLTAITDLKSIQPFNGITTFTLITEIVKFPDFIRFSKGRNKSFLYRTLKKDSSNGNIQSVSIRKIGYDEMDMKEHILFGTEKMNKEMDEIMHPESQGFLRPEKAGLSVRYGFCTTADSVFIKDKFDFDSDMIIPVYKPTTGKWRKCIFPYDQHDGTPLIFNDKDLSDYFIQNRKTLLKGKTEETVPNWCLFGKSQGLKDIGKWRIAMSNIFKPSEPETSNIAEIPPGSGIYNGLYIVSQSGKRLDFKLIRKILESPEFYAYGQMFGRYKRGGWFEIKAVEVEKILNWKLSGGRMN